MTATEKAAQKLKEILIQRFFDTGLGFRVTGNADQSSLATLDIKLDNQRPGDEVIELYGMKFFLDQSSAALLSDYELDYIEEPTRRFLIKRP